MSAMNDMLRILREIAPNARKMRADSRCIEAGDIFLAYPGAAHDGRLHIASAIHAGAAAVVWESASFEWDTAWRVPHLPLLNLKALAPALAAAWYGQPSHDLWTIGITGTNGKTSVAQWLAAALTDIGRKTAAIGTLGNGFPGDLKAASHTTPDAVSLHTLLADYRHDGASAVAMEVSSHGLDQGRVEGVAFDIAVFTNLSRDHLDYHGDMQRYAAAKARLFAWPTLQGSVINADDAAGVDLLAKLAGTRGKVLSYGLRTGALRAEKCQADHTGLRLDIVSPWGRGVLNSPLLGEFNAYNLLAVLGALLLSDVPLPTALAALEKLRPVAGRMQRVLSNPDAMIDAPTVIVDFAHTPDALDKVLTALKPLTTGRLICVFGCGGGRDTGKRPLMGAAVAAQADWAIVTSDNPRNEDPEYIVQGILAGMPPQQTVVLARRQAIQQAIMQAAAGDIVVLAGKGHEDYQEIHGVKHPFSDYEEARLALLERSKTKQPSLTHSENQIRNSHVSA